MNAKRSNPEERGLPTPHGMLKRICQSVGLASLVLVVNYNDLLGGGENARMHVPYRLTSVGLAQIADILLLGIVFFVVRELLHRTRFYEWARLILMILAPPYLIERSRPLIPLVLKDGLILSVAAIWAALLLLFVLEFPRWYRFAIRVGDGVGIFAAAFGLCSLAQIAGVMMWRPGPQQIQVAWAAKAQPPRQHPRLVWIIFDELSYDQLFEDRSRDLALPNFDDLRSQSTLYTQMQPVGLKTVKVIPSLLTGRTIDDFHYRFSNKFVVHYADTRGWQTLNAKGTVFADAKQQGWRTAAVGWYNPYCTIYGSALDSCYWTNFDPIGMDVAEGESFWSNAWRPMAELGTELRSPQLAGRQGCDFGVRQHLQSHLDLESHASTVLANDQADFIFLHMAIPHSPNIWNRSNGVYVKECGSSYLDNLALADRQLGEMMAQLRKSPRWKDTTLIVQGDHSWRIMLWDWLPAWTDEDDQASHGVFDPRPALLIHDAGQTQAQTDPRALPLSMVHGAIENVLAGRPAQP